MDVNLDEVEINGTVYVKKGSEAKACEKVDGMPYVIVRTFSAGVFAGYLKERNGKEGVIVNSRRLWYWSGAASLSQLSQEGVSKPNDCKFAMVVPVTELSEIIEVIHVSEKAKAIIDSVKIWKV